MILTYLAGPFTASTPWEIEVNIRAAEEAAELILKARDDVSLIVPHSLSRCFVGRAGTPQYWYDATMRMLEACEAVVMIDRWQHSTGARNELRRAIQLGLSIYDSQVSFANGCPPISLQRATSILESAETIRRISV